MTARPGGGRRAAGQTLAARLAGMVALALVAAGATALAVVAVRGEPAARTQAEQAHQIAATLRCPICEDLSVADSPAPLAAQMRQQIAQELAAGASAEQIRNGFVASYCDSVLLSPPHRGLAQVAYLLPVALFCVGAVATVLLLRGRRRRAGTTPGGGATGDLSDADRHRLESALARLREEEP